MLAIALTIGALLCATIAYAHGRRAGAREAEEDPDYLLAGRYRIKPTPKVWEWCVEFSSGWMTSYLTEEEAKLMVKGNPGSRLVKVRHSPASYVQCPGNLLRMRSITRFALLLIALPFAYCFK